MKFLPPRGLLILLTLLSGCRSMPAPLQLEPAVAPATVVRLAKPKGLVPVAAYDPAIRTDLRYATPDNVFKKILYPSGFPALAADSTARKLAAANRTLKSHGLRILVLDAYRPPEVQWQLFQMFRDDKFVADPRKKWSKHCYGRAVDVTLTDLSGRALEMPSTFDDFSKKAAAAYTGPNPAVRRRITLLQKAMTSAGFSIYDDEWWLGRRRSTPVPVKYLDPGIQQWLGRDNVEAVADFAVRRVDEFYGEVARMQGKTDARYFTEKCWPGACVPQLLAELCPNSREIILVRDFRDMVCSILSFNKKLGYDSFGRQLADSDAKFIRQLRDSAVRTLEHWRERGERAHLLRYEDLILRPEPTLKAALEYLGLDSSPEVVAATLQRATALTPELQHGHSTSKDPAASIGRWRRDLDDGLKRECAEAFGDVLVQFGYDT